MTEAQVIEWVQKLSPPAKQTVLKSLIPEMDVLEALVDYGSQRMRELCARRGLEWARMTEDERQRLVDELLHEA